MIPNGKAFNGKTFFEHEGKKYYRWHNIQRLGDYQLHFRFIKVNSPYQQGIVLFFSNFKGSIALNGKKLPTLKGKFQHYTFRQDEIPNNEFTLSVHAEDGSLIIGNGSQILGDACLECGSLGCAFWIEELDENMYRFHCNDHEYDDDFDDLIFDMIITDL